MKFQWIVCFQYLFSSNGCIEYLFKQCNIFAKVTDSHHQNIVSSNGKDELDKQNIWSVEIQNIAPPHAILYRNN